MAGRIWKKDRVSLTNFPPMGYGALWALGLEFNGAGQMGGKGGGARSWGGCGGAAIVGGEKLAGASHAAATRFGFPLRAHRGKEEVKASLSRGKTGPRQWPARRSAAAPWPAPRSSRLGH